MREDHFTTTPADAAAYLRAHGHDADPPEVIAPEDVDFRMDDPHDCIGPGCWSCFLLPEVTARLVAEIRGRSS